MKRQRDEFIDPYTLYGKKYYNPYTFPMINGVVCVLSIKKYLVRVFIGFRVC